MAVLGGGVEVKKIAWLVGLEEKIVKVPGEPSKTFFKKMLWATQANVFFRE